MGSSVPYCLALVHLNHALHWPCLSSSTVTIQLLLCYHVTVTVVTVPVITGRADPDFTKKLKWQPLQELTFKDLATQVWGARRCKGQ